MLKTIFFDVGNVLIFFDLPKMYRQIAQCTGLSQEKLQQILFQEKMQEKYESGKIDSDTLHQAFLSISPKQFSEKELFESVSNIFTPNTELFPLIRELKRGGIQLILLSNTSDWHWKKIYTDHPILQEFDDQVLSFQVKALKPSPEIFQHALSKVTCDPQDCFYIDDIPEFIEGAKKVGLNGEIFTSVPALKASLAFQGITLYNQSG